MVRLSAAADTVLEIIQRAAALGQTIQRDTRSRAIENIGYEPDSGVMSLRFVDKGRYPTYRYPSVPAEEVAKFIAARSKGKHYHRHIKSQYGLGG